MNTNHSSQFTISNTLIGVSSIYVCGLSKLNREVGRSMSLAPSGTLIRVVLLSDALHHRLV